MTKIAVIILNWNKADLTLACAASVLKAFSTLNPKAVKGKLLIVDNASNASDRAKLAAGLAGMSAAQNLPHQLILNESNGGYAAGMNSGINQIIDSPLDYVWLLNNDTVVDSHAMRALLIYAGSHPEASILGATIGDLDTGLIKAAGGHQYHPWLGLNQPCLRGNSLASLQIQQMTPKLDYIDGASLWLRGDFLRRIGGLPQEQFLYFEELCLGRMLKNNESIAWCPEAIIYHLEGGSTPTQELEAKSAYHAAVSAFKYTRQHHFICLPTVILARLLGVGFRSIVRFQPSLFRAVVTALRDFFLKRNRTAYEL